MSVALHGQEGGVRRLTRTEREILSYVAAHEGRLCTKEAMAASLGRNKKTVDRLVRRLKDEGLLVVTPVWDKRGARLGNTYYLARLTME